MHKCLEFLDVSLANMLDTHPLALLSLSFYTRLLQSDVGALESRSRRSPVLATLSRPPMARSSLEVPRQEASPFRSLSSVCASLLKAYLVFSCLYYKIITSANFVYLELLYSSPRGPWLVI